MTERRRNDGLVTTLQEADSTPLVCIHPGSGHIAAFQAFPAKLGPEQAVYAVRAVGLRDEAPPLTTVAEMADRYVRELSALPLRDPITFCGWSIGGAVAIEVARALTAAGRRVGSVVLIDTWAPSGLPFLTLSDQKIHFAKSAIQIASLVGVAVTLDDLRRYPPPKEPTPATMIAGLEHIIVDTAKLANVPVPERVLGARVRAILRVYASTIAAYQKFDPQRYDGRVVLVRAENAEYEFVRAISRDYGWGPHLSRPVEVVDAPGNHFTIMQGEHLTALTEVLKRTLATDRAEA